MIFPLCVTIMLFSVGAVMMIVGVPKLTNILSESGVTLPISTRILIGISSAFVHYWWLILGGIGLVSVIGMVWMYKGSAGKDARTNVDR